MDVISTKKIYLFFLRNAKNAVVFCGEHICSTLWASPAMDAVLMMTPPRPPLNLLICSRARYATLITPTYNTEYS